MESLKNKVAFITGGGHGIGLSIGRIFAQQGAHVVLADINEKRLAIAKETLASADLSVETVVCDVADPDALRRAADFTLERFGKVHIVVNNAGVSLAGKPGKIPLEDWRWIVDINLMSVAYGVEIFTPLIQSHGEGGYFINTASMAGHIAGPAMSPYHATKFAVVGYSESIRADLAADNIGVSVLCPAWVRTDIHNAGVNKPSLTNIATADESSSNEPEAGIADIAAVIESGIAPDDLAQWVLECMREKRFYIFSHPSMTQHLDARAALIKADYGEIVNDGRFLGH
ncbi:SDR family NAD(P)-dependent oxidoreductase [Gammaproteobacteria bacterium]|nr:SDR family NAD(P)-dependent oxidoreductase [Gammaproteobacteria bacterium]